ncbi:MAG: DUF3187 family protein [Nitrospira sp.]|nr:DUF3187 family protein [Nitrospira sp.]MCY3955586.1 DUF3187 family protein [Nitrospira sp.]
MITWFRLLCMPRSAISTALACVFMVSWPAAAVSGEFDDDAVAMPLRIVNLNPFFVPYGVPVSVGTHTMSPGSSHLTFAVDTASYLSSAASGSERLLLDGETYRTSLMLRRGFRPRWEYFLELSAVGYHGGVFDSFIEGWHDFFGLPQGGRDVVPHDRLALIYGDGTGARVNLQQDVFSLGDLALGVGYAVPDWPIQNDGLTIRGNVKIPTGNAGSFTGLGRFSTSLWAETSGALPWSAESRAWLYTATLGLLVAEPPKRLSSMGGPFIGFGRASATWRALSRLNLTVQVDVHSSPYSSSDLDVLADPVIILGFGGSIRVTDQATLEIAVTEDDGLHRAAPDIGLHTALRWRL